MPENDSVQIAGDVIEETTAMFLFYDGARYRWVHKAMVKDHRDGYFTMPREYAEKKGFI